MTDKVKIDADDLTEARLSADGARVLISLLDDRGRKVSLSLPARCLNAVLSVVPRHAEPESVHRLDSWTMAPAENGQDLVLTLRTPEGLAISFTLKPWQVEGMATIATHGHAQRRSRKSSTDLPRRTFYDSFRRRTTVTDKKRRKLMLSRRDGMKLAIAAGMLAIGGETQAAGAPTVKTPVNFKVPAGACDCHVHVFPDPARFPFWSGRGYTPPVATAGDLLALQHALHMDHVVIVTPSVYGTDNAATLDGMRQLGRKRARGVAVIGPATTKAQIAGMDKAGVRGIRVNLESNGVTDPSAAAANFDAAAAQIKDTRWHMQFYARLPVLAALKDRLASMPMPAVFDHFAGAKAALGVNQPGFDMVLDLVRSGKAYVKISGAYRASEKAPDYPDVAPLARALIAANPDRVIWGSDWPHPGPAAKTPADINTPFAVDDGRVLNLLAEWAPDAATRHKILVDNPARLYGF